jgi:hypothetical protein
MLEEPVKLPNLLPRRRLIALISSRQKGNLVLGFGREEAALGRL